MRTTIGYQSDKVSKDRLLAIDFHDFVAKSGYLNDVEIAQEFGITKWEIESLKSRIR
ncbi:MAG: hypothetical protein JWN30_211 [Bacilli bacterium]|nr:hypothetical protein [Bacilli bacterium]